MLAAFWLVAPAIAMLHSFVYFLWYGSWFSKCDGDLAGVVGITVSAFRASVSATARVVILAFVICGWLVNVCHEHLGQCLHCHLACAHVALLPWTTRVVGLGVVADSRSH